MIANFLWADVTSNYVKYNFQLECSGVYSDEMVNETPVQEICWVSWSAIVGVTRKGTKFCTLVNNIYFLKNPLLEQTSTVESPLCSMLTPFS